MNRISPKSSLILAATFASVAAVGSLPIIWSEYQKITSITTKDKPEPSIRKKECEDKSVAGKVHCALRDGNIDAFNALLQENKNTPIVLKSNVTINTNKLLADTVFDFSNIQFLDLHLPNYSLDDLPPKEILIKGGIYNRISVDAENIVLEDITADTLSVGAYFSAEPRRNISIKNGMFEYVIFYNSISNFSFEHNSIGRLDLRKTIIDNSSFLNTTIRDAARFYKSVIKKTNLKGFNGANLHFSYSDIDLDSLQTNKFIHDEYVGDTSPIKTSEVIVKIKQNENPTSFTCRLLEKNKGVFLGDYHPKLNFPLWVAESMEDFKNCGVTTLYLEMIAFKDNHLLDNYYAGNQGALESLASYLMRWEWAPGTAATRFEIIRRAKDAGIRIRGIDTASDVEDEFLFENRSAIERSKDWTEIIKDFELASPSPKYLLFGGHFHSNGLRDLYGTDTSLGIPSISIADSDGDTQITLSDGIDHDYQLVLPETPYDGLGLPGEGFIFFKNTLDIITGKFDAPDSDQYDIIVNAASTLREALEIKSYNGLQKAYKVIQQARNSMSFDPDQYNDRLLGFPLEVYQRIADGVPHYEKGYYDLFLINHMSEMAQSSLQLISPNIKPGFHPH